MSDYFISIDDPANYGEGSAWSGNAMMFGEFTNSNSHIPGDLVTINYISLKSDNGTDTFRLNGFVFFYATITAQTFTLSAHNAAGTQIGSSTSLGGFTTTTDAGYNVGYVTVNGAAIGTDFNSIVEFRITPSSPSNISVMGIDNLVVATAIANNAPTVSGAPASVAATEDTASNIDLSAITFADTDGDSLTVTLGVDAGTLAATSGGSVTVGGSGTASLTLSGTAANINTYLDTTTNISYTGASNANGAAAATMTITPNDGTIDGTAATVDIDITAVNDVPAFGGLDGTPTFTEGGSAVTLDSNVTLSDVELDAADDYTGASLTIARNGGANSDDSFSFDTNLALFSVSGANLQVSGNTFATFSVSSGTLTIDFTGSGDIPTGALVDNVLQRIQYSNTNDAPPASAQLDWTFNDGTDNGAGSTTVSLTTVNDAPTLTATASNPTFTEGGSAVTVFSGTAISTVESGQTLASLQITVTNVDGTSDETINIDGANISLTNGVSGLASVFAAYSVAVSSGTATITLSGAVSDAATMSNLIDNLTYSNVSDNPASTASTRVITLTSLTDSGGTSNGGSNTVTLSIASTVTLSVVNDDPSASTIPASLTVTEDTASGLDLSGMSLSDPDLGAGNLTILMSVDSGTIALTNPAANSLTGSGNGTGSISLTGTIANIEAYLDTPTNLSYTGAANLSGNGAATLTIKLNDNGNSGSGGGSDVTVGTVAINITDVNDLPALTAPSGAASFTESSGTPVAIDSAITVNDVDSATLASATVSITANFQSGNDTLAFSNSGGMGNIGGSYNGSTGVLSLTSSGATATLAEWQAALRAVTFENDSTDPSASGGVSRTISFVLNDGTDDSATVTQTVTITTVNDAPTSSSTGASASFTEGGSAVSLFSATTSSTVESGQNITGFVVGMTHSDGTANELLLVDGTSIAVIDGNSGTTSGNSLSFVVSQSGGADNPATVTFSGGSLSTAQFNAVINGIQWQSTSDNPTGYGYNYRSFYVGSVKDNGGTANGGSDTQSSTTGTASVTITAVNDVPVLSAPSSAINYSENDSATVIDSAITITDADSSTLASATVSVSANFASDQDLLAFTNSGGMGNVSGSYNSGTGVLTLTSSGATATLAEWQAALRAVTYANSSDAPSTSARTISFVVNDGTDDSTAGTQTINITAVNDSPSASGVPSDVSVTEDTASNFDLSGVSFADVDTTGSVSVVLAASAGTFAASSGGSVTVGGSGTGTLTLAGTVANINTYLGSASAIQYTGATDAAGDNAATASLTIDDGEGSGAVSLGTINIDITAVDDPAVVTGTVTGSVTEGDVGDSPVTATGSISISDVDVGEDPAFADEASSVGDNGYGSFVLASGTWTYTLNQAAVQDLDAGDSVTDTHTFTADDGTTQVITITISGSADAPVLGGDVSGDVDEGDTGQGNSGDVSAASGTLTISDSDGDDTPTFSDVTATSGDNNFGSFVLNSGAWTYTLNQGSVQDLDDGDVVTDSHTFSASDGSTLTVTIMIHGSNDAPTLNTLPDLTLDEGDAATVLLPTAYFTDAEGNLDGASLTLSGLLAEDTLALNNVGTGSGQIGVSAGTVSYEGTAIGSVSGGNGTDLGISLNANATVAAVQALLRQITFFNGSEEPTASRTLQLDFSDAGGASLRTPPAFTLVSGSGNPLNGLGVDSNSMPVFADLDGDGDRDLLIGQGDGSLRYFENSGDAQNPAYLERTGGANPLNGFSLSGNAAPIVLDIDDDGDLDIISGSATSGVSYFENIGTSLQPAYSEISGAGNPLNGFGFGNDSSPAFADLDNDGDQDIVVGSASGALQYFENTGAAIFTEHSGGTNPFDALSPGAGSHPLLQDVDFDGDMDLLVGTSAGTVAFYRNDGNATTPVFTAVTGSANPFDGVSLSQAAAQFVDIDHDGDNDAFIGQADGSISFFAGASANSLIVTVNSINDIPVISGTPGTSVDEDSPYSFTPTASDADTADTLTFSIANQPAWASFDPATGTLSGTPLNANVGITNGIVISVSDGTASADLASFNLTVVNTNDDPVIGGTPATSVTAGQNYQFIPTVSDVDVGDSLTYSISGMPVWASFNNNTGELSGTPTQADVGSSTIIISVNDGTTIVSLPSFSLTVQPAVDTDGDTIPDFQEVIDNTDPNDPEDYLDNTAPVVSAPDEIVIDATALYTPVSPLQLLGLPADTSAADLTSAQRALATDNVDGANCCIAQPANLLNGKVLLPPGRKLVTWQAVDHKGNVGSITQVVNVRPLVSLSKDQVSAEGAQARIKVILNGPSPFYPLTVPYAIDSASTADGSDHDLVDGSVTFTETNGVGQIEAFITVNVVDDGAGEDTETLIVKLDDATSDAEDLANGYDAINPDIYDINAGARSRHVLSIVEGNVAPDVRLNLQQGGLNTIQVTASGGTVTVTASVSDPNVGDSHSYNWSASSSALVDTDGNTTDSTLEFNPGTLATGRYTVDVTVTDSANATDTERLTFLVVDALPVLNSGDDSDDDGIDDATEGTADSDDDGIPDYLDNISAGNVLPETASQTTSYLVESDPGVRMRLGQFALTSTDGGARLSDADILAQSDITPDSRYQHSGGTFDFEVRDLPSVGQSVRIVLPQLEPIPAGALYRKFQNGAWMTFVQDANNALHSAPGNPGFCPPPGDTSWETGLQQGYYCVQLTLEDGGPNDADGLANAAIEDPGAVASSLSSSTRIHSKGKGGSLDWWLLAVLATAVLMRRRSLRSSMLALAGLALLLPLSGRVDAVELPDMQTLQQNSYLQGGLFQAHGSQSRSDFSSDMAASGNPVSAVDYDASRVAWRVALGYQFNAAHAVELGYLDLGEVKVDFDADISDQAAFTRAVENSYPITSFGITLSYRYRYALNHKLMLSAEAGLYLWNGDISLSGEDVHPDLDSGTDPLLGAQLDYQLDQIDPRLSIGAAITRVMFNGQHVDLFGLMGRWDW